MAETKFSLAKEFGRSPSRRPSRVADAILREVSLLLLSGVKDPRLAGVTVTRVDVTNDLRRAVIFFTCGGNDVDQTAAGLASARGFIRSVLARALTMRYVPELVFKRDESIEQMARIDELLAQDPAERR